MRQNCASWPNSALAAKTDFSGLFKGRVNLFLFYTIMRRKDAGATRSWNPLCKISNADSLVTTDVA
jgi:hypothetical protein